ncbi:mannose-6-phosphate isomerase, class I [Actinocorallia sp. A-T 12471]|uniref:mannose-6-phosphate isomerase, class I n=1 Tax=Actinocorallia sp. A-T 12471 TaxID=3089813 RepID=UPI0029D05CD7|nr:mannose-6-phosphate isomerase, class I [Actinocorallia sp. A-T 12471]MDX6743531.1 mannose-6-phosphate isomerase, class I [Actinocorallia sp. A-T 12471]
MIELLRLDNPIRAYAWGSREVLARLLGRPAPSGSPEAELWIGAHPGDPSRIAGAGSLLERIDADPGPMLGPGTDRLPFLLKVLAVESALSIQVHPDAAQAALGYRREEQCGPPVGDPKRCYHDDWPKPELLYAVTPFEALCGFRPPAEAAAQLRSLGGPRLAKVAGLLEQEGNRAGVVALTGWPYDDRAGLVAEAARAGGWVADLAERHPGDPGVAVALLLHHVTLQPGQALFARPRTIHAYLRGTAVEIMASSDNVLRGGLTPKHVDLPELLAVTDFAPSPPELVAPVRQPNGEDLFPAPCTQFQLTRLRLERGAAVRVADPGPGALLCLEGELEVTRGAACERIGPGQALFLPHDGGAVAVAGDGLGFRAGVPS